MANAPTALNLNRGYTMHEHLDEFELINMNGRVYGPTVAQFLSPDPYIQDAGNWLNYNRYAYCYNNPTRYVDPSGEVIVALVSDFLYTLCSGGLNFNKSIRQNAWKRFDPSAPWSITNQSWQITKGLFKSDKTKSTGGQIWQVASRFLYEPVQTLSGYLSAQTRNLFHCVDRVDYYGGATFVTNEQGRKEWGFSLGSFINTNIKGTIDKPFNEYITTHKPMYMHEYGHYLQSQKTGYLYAFTAIYSFLATKWFYAGEAEFSQRDWVPRVNFTWSEVWANRLAKDYFSKREGVNWAKIKWKFPIEYGLY